MKILRSGLETVVARDRLGGNDGDLDRAARVPGVRGCVLAGLALVAVLAASTAAAQQTWPYYRIIDLGVVPDGTTSDALAVNADGTVVVGQSKVGTKTLPALWRNGAMEVLGDPSIMTAGAARGVNGPFADPTKHYKIVGEYTDIVTKKKRAFVWDTAGGFRELPRPENHFEASGWDVNEAGKIIGYTAYDPYLGKTVTRADLRNQAVPALWTDEAQPPSILFSGPMQNYNTTSCAYSGHKFDISRPIRINDQDPLGVVSTWVHPVDNECYQLYGATVLSIVVPVAVKNVLGTPAAASWKSATLPQIRKDYNWANPKVYDWTNSIGVDINNNGVVVDYGRYLINTPGIGMYSQASASWYPGTPDVYKGYRGTVTCQADQFYVRAINDSNVIVASTLRQTDQGTNCLDGKPYTIESVGVVFDADETVPIKYLKDRVRADCGWTRLLPSDINNAGMIVGTGVRTGAGTRAFLMIPVDSLPASQEEGCSAGTEETDNQPPIAHAGPDQTLEATSPAGAAVTLNGSASSDPDGDPLDYQWSTQVGEATGVSPSLTLPIGMHAVTLTVTDDKDASDTDTVIVTVEDTAPPDTIITSAPPPRMNSTTAEFSFEGTDIATVPEALTFECSLDGGAFTACTSPTAYSGLADGEHQFAVRAVDGVGIWDPTPATHAWTQDMTPPETTITGAPAAITSAATATFTFQGSDAQAPAAALSFECSLDGGAWSACTSPTAFSGVADGAHQFAVRAADDLGNVDATPASHSWTMDATPPTIAIASPADGVRFLVGASASASYSCNDGGSGIDSCVGTVADGGALDTYTPGSFALAVNAADKAGNSSSLSHAYRVGYGVCNHQEFGARRVGSVIPMKLQACDVSGANLSRGTLVVTAVNVRKVSDSATSPVIDAGNANPDLNFRYDPALFGGAGGYIFNMDTSGLTTGTYRLNFRIGSDPTVLSVPFELR
jgi:hypothetical protein